MVEKKENKGNEKICISLPPAQLKAIDERRGLIPRSTFISELVDVVWVEMTDKEEKEEQT